MNVMKNMNVLKYQDMKGSKLVSFRVLLVALWMMVCGSTSVFAIQSGDIVTIRSYAEADHYLTINAGNNGVEDYHGTTPTEKSLWRILQNGEGYAFESLAAPGNYLYAHMTQQNNAQYGDMYELQISKTICSFYYIQNVNGTVGKQEENMWIGGLGCTTDPSATSSTNRYIRYKSTDTNPWENLGRPNASAAPVVVVEKWIDEDEGGNGNEDGNENEGGLEGLPFEIGDTITISYKNGNTYNYLAASDTDNSTVNKTEVDNYCLWKVTLKNGKYLFTSITDSKKLLVVEIERNPSYTKYLRTASESDGFAISKASTQGLYYMRYDLGLEDKADFVRYHYKSFTWGVGSSENRSLTFEKWTSQEEEVVDASIKDGDVITISYKNGNTYNYLAANANGNAIVNKTTEDAYCLWTVAVSASGQYLFTNVGDSKKVLATEGQKKNLLTTAGGSLFRLEESSTKGLYHIRYTYPSDNYDYVRYHHEDLIWGIGGSDYRKLTLEKWIKKEKKGELQGVFTQGNVDVSLSGVKLENLITDLNNGVVGNDGAKEVTLTITRGAEELYYQCVGRNVKVTVGKGDQDETDINLSAVSCAWSSSGSEVSSTNCSNYKDATVQNRGVLHVTTGAPAKTNTSLQYQLTISPMGSSPMDLKSADGTRWTDYTDNIVVTFSEGGTTYREVMSVTRYSYHKEELPELDVKVNPTSHTFLREGESQNFAFTCVHQHGASVRHMYDMVADNRFNKETMIYEVQPETLALTNSKLTVTFALENSSWISKGTLSNDILPLTAKANNTGQQRDTKLVATFKYRGQDTHEKVIEVPLSQNAKDEGTVFHHQKGIANTTFGVNPHTKQNEQKVHTAEKTIYYLPETNVQLILPGKTFLSYQRWYDYATDRDPRYNTNESDRTTWVTAPKGFGINPQLGRSYGIYDIDTTITIVAEPILKTWKYDKNNLAAACHTIACDLSNYKDYTIVKQSGQTTSITEPTLSYRQLWHFRPAEEMAEKLDKCTGSTYLETYYYTAPVGTKINLITDYHHSLNDATQNSYFYNAANPIRISAANLTWYKGNQVMNKNYSTKDFQIVSSSTVGEVTYYLRASVGGKTLNIAKFIVRYVDKHKYGPTTKEIISYNDIANKYDLLEEINFNYTPLPTSATKNTQHYAPLPWGESTYGYYYPNGVSGLKYYRHSNRKDFNIPYYGEYALLNYMKADWATGAQHGGGAKGYALFVDGTEEPGLVANISTDAVVCSGQTMYCSMWLLNPRTSEDEGANPAFRCNIQGRNHGDEEWQDVGIFCTGEIVGYTGWHQVVFPIESDVTYDETRVSIYNFGTGGNGNDFMVDDICLYASSLPLATYHNSTGCSFDAQSEKTSTVLVVRVDYSKLQFEREKHIYYQIVDITDNANTIVVLQDAAGNSLYHQEATDGSNKYGSILIPEKVDNNLLREDAESVIEELKQQSGAPAAKCFVQDKSTGNYYLYLIQMIPNDEGGKSDQYLDRDRMYELRVAYDADELDESACVFISPLNAKQDTYIQLRNERTPAQRITSEGLGGLCANNHYFLEVKVKNEITSASGRSYTKEAVIYADWLKGFSGDDVYCDDANITSQQKATADQAFKSAYGYSRSEVKNAITAMRAIDGPNFRVSDPNQLRVDITNGFATDQLLLIRDLCRKGVLQLYKQTLPSYLGNNATARYWAYPISDTTTVLVEGKRYSLQGCNEPKWVRLQAEKSAYGVNFLFAEEGQDIPTMRTIEGVNEVQMPIQLIGNTKLHSTLNYQNGKVKFNIRTSIKENVLEFVSNDDMSVIKAPQSLETGTKYLMRLTLYDENSQIVGTDSECGLGYAYFYLMIVPVEVQWKGEVSSEWDDDANWKGGCAPLPESNVIIPAEGPYPVLSASKTSRTNSSSSSNTCNNIYFEPGAMLLDLHNKLQYDSAFVDMRITATTWQSVSAPLQGMYSGDMFIPHEKNDFNPQTTLLESTDTFAVSPFRGTRNSWAPYAFWVSVYNKNVPTYHENGALSYQKSETAVFVPTNGLNHRLEPGTGYQLLGFDPTNEPVDLTIRLPKPDTHYYYFDSLGNQSTRGVDVQHSSKLAFTPDANGVMKITLKNDVASNRFMFGNPAMANIDMQAFLADNGLSPAYYTMSNSSWEATIAADSTTGGMLPPMRSVLVQLKDGASANELTVYLKTEHLRVPAKSAKTGLISQIAPRRAPSAQETMQMMTIYALSDWGQARCVLAANMSAYDTYEHDEDALFISSGVEQGMNDDAATSPINIYTVSEQVPMMLDVRENISEVPLAMLVHDDYVTETVRFVFYLSLNWTKECYLYDAVAKVRYPIVDGLVLELPAPANHEARYYIEGPDKSADGDVTTSTTHPTGSSATQDFDIWAYSPSQGEMVVSSNDILREVKVYDLSGRLIACQQLDLQYNKVTMTVPTGLCIVKATNRDNTHCYIQTLVK